MELEQAVVVSEIATKSMHPYCCHSKADCRKKICSSRWGLKEAQDDNSYLLALAVLDALSTSSIDHQEPYSARMQRDRTLLRVLLQTTL